ncbi:MAG: PqiC family protein [Desulfobacterales bacterium]
MDFYTLTAMHEPQPARPSQEGMAIAIGPVTIPAALDRSQIVTRDGTNKIRLSENHRWAGPLQQDIAAVLADNISGLLKSERVAPFTREDLFEPTHRVIVDITRFDGQLDKEIILDVVWSIKKITDNKPLVMRRSFVRETVSSPTYDDFVAAQSKALATLSKEIVDSLKKMSNP